MRIDWERWARAAGMLTVALFAIGFAVLGEDPTEDDPAEIISTFADHGQRVLVGETIILVSFVFAARFFGTVANLLRESGEGRLGATSLVLGAIVLGAQTILQALDTTLAQGVAGRRDQDVTLALHSLTWNIDVATSMLLAGYVFFVSAALTRARILPRWYRGVSLVLTALVFLRATNWAADGIWAPNGEYLYIGIPSILIWLALTSGLLFARYGKERETLTRTP